MLDGYNKSQSIAYKTVKNQIDNNLVSHAYIIESSFNDLGFNFAKSFAKSLLCPNKFTNNNNCNNCNQCSKIDQNNFIELKIIEPQGLWITKDQIMELQDTFLKKPLIGNRKIYIINHFDKMKKILMDKMLKFIEEPSEGIVAILVTENINNVMDTIVSRCQIIKLKSEKKQSDKLLERISYNIDSTKYPNIVIDYDILDKIIKIISYYEDNHLKILLYTKEMWYDNFDTPEKNSFALDIMLLFYKDILDYKIEKSINVFNDYIDLIKKIANNNSVEEISKKISVIIKMKEKIKYNINKQLLVDKLIIEMEKR